MTLPRWARFAQKLGASDDTLMSLACKWKSGLGSLGPSLDWKTDHCIVTAPLRPSVARVAPDGYAPIDHALSAAIELVVKDWKRQPNVKRLNKTLLVELVSIDRLAALAKASKQNPDLPSNATYHGQKNPFSPTRGDLFAFRPLGFHSPLSYVYGGVVVVNKHTPDSAYVMVSSFNPADNILANELLGYAEWVCGVPLNAKAPGGHGNREDWERENEGRISAVLKKHL